MLGDNLLNLIVLSLVYLGGTIGDGDLVKWHSFLVMTTGTAGRSEVRPLARRNGFSRGMNPNPMPGLNIIECISTLKPGDM